MTMQLEVPTSQIESNIRTLRTSVESLAIIDQPTYDHAISFLTSVIVPLRKKITETFGPIKAKTHAAWKEAVAQEKKHLDPVDVAERLLKGKIGQWEMEQERRRQEEQRRLEVEARKREEDERLEAALAAEDDGASSEEVEAIMESPATPVAVVAPATFQRAKGVSTRESWRAEITDMLALVRFVAANRQWLGLVEPNATALNQLARAQKSLLSIPGVRAVRDSIVNVR